MCLGSRYTEAEGLIEGTFEMRVLGKNKKPAKLIAMAGSILNFSELAFQAPN
jgi:hypothetical protein